MTQEPNRQKSLATKSGRFVLVGIANTLIDLAVFSLLVAAGMAALVANVLAWLVAVVFSYAVNSRWSFDRDTRLSDARSALRFISLGAVISLGISSGFLLALTGVIGVMPAKIFGVIVAAILNFIAARWSIEDRLL
ncbi:GtrA family protein [Mesorhizobium xinjiangense]|uniref:GtrA family protein n=1 Tax=Mesorhizobium xinjiangense TaxID=2678685 RepID=UPI0012EEDABE|nr:GtrA family protein [Mesorhizobium xinjiangense]